jgi:hypothetical protein
VMGAELCQLAWADAHSETPHPVLADHPAVKVQGPTKPR